MEHACLWKRTGSAPRCSCHGNSIEYLFFHTRPSLFRGVSEKQKDELKQRGEMRGQNMRQPERQRDQG